MFFKKIINLFTKNQPDELNQQSQHSEEDCEDEEEIIGSITYYVKANSEDIFLDLFLSSYEEESLLKFAKILSGIASLRVQLQTVDMLKSCFNKEDEDVFNRILQYVIVETNKDIQSYTTSTQQKETNVSKESQPWIKPSEIIK